jgi:PhnB protein
MILRMNPYITLDGKTKEAIEFYKEALDATVIAVQTFGEMPEDPSFPIPADAKDRVLHSLLKIGETDLMFSDTFPGQPLEIGSNVSIALVVNNEEKTTQIYDKLQQGGQVKMQLQKTFWSPAYAIILDKFGVTWQITTESDAEEYQPTTT